MGPMKRIPRIEEYAEDVALEMPSNQVHFQDQAVFDANP